VSYYDLEPDVAGGLGKNTVMDRSVHPPIVRKLHYEFYGWSGDALVTSFPCYLVTDEARQELENAGITGAQFEKAEITTSDEFDELFPNVRLPRFVWLKVRGQLGLDDFGTAPDGKLVVSDTAIGVLQRLGIPNALVTPRSV
jgi:hypothetical protein